MLQVNATKVFSERFNAPGTEGETIKFESTAYGKGEIPKTEVKTKAQLLEEMRKMGLDTSSGLTPELLREYGDIRANNDRKFFKMTMGDTTTVFGYKGTEESAKTKGTFGTATAPAAETASSLVEQPSVPVTSQGQGNAPTVDIAGELSVGIQKGLAKRKAGAEERTQDAGEAVPYQPHVPEKKGLGARLLGIVSGSGNTVEYNTSPTVTPTSTWTSSISRETWSEFSLAGKNQFGAGHFTRDAKDVANRVLGWLGLGG